MIYWMPKLTTDFNPRSLAGATSRHASICFLSEFQSTLPRGSDIRFAPWERKLYISIHAPSRERHMDARQITYPSSDFNPRSLAGATEAKEKILKHRQISIHAPSRERHKANDWAIRCVHISIHAPSRERRQLLYLVV